MTRRNDRTGFTLLELLMTVTVIVIAASMVLPSLRDESRLRLMAASNLISSDIELAQVMTISRPSQPVIVKFDAENDIYWLAYAESPDIPVTRPDTLEPYVVVLGEGRARAALGVALELIDVPDDQLTFNAQGGLESVVIDPAVEMELGSKWIRLAFAPTTGSMTESYGELPGGGTPPPAGGGGPAKITVCHRGKTREVPLKALESHLAHGDTLGPCPED